MAIGDGKQTMDRLGSLSDEKANLEAELAGEPGGDRETVIKNRLAGIEIELDRLAGNLQRR